MRARRTSRACSLRTFDRLDCAANAKINLRCIYIFSVHSLTVVVHALTCSAFTEPRDQGRGSATIAATLKCGAGTETSSL